jgi:hypothetical protein
MSGIRLRFRWRTEQHSQRAFGLNAYHFTLLAHGLPVIPSTPPTTPSTSTTTTATPTVTTGTVTTEWVKVVDGSDSDLQVTVASQPRPLLLCVIPHSYPVNIVA